MSYQYSSFISYRRNEGDIKFLKNFKLIIETEASRVTNKKEAFFDEVSIEWGKNFDEKIYASILSSYFFIPIYHYGYLHIENIWCARELYFAIQLERKIRKAISKSTFSFILPILYRGSPSSMPICINRKKAYEIKRLEYGIRCNKESAALTEFRHYLYETFLENFNLLKVSNINLPELYDKINYPSDSKIKNWIISQKKEEKKSEAKFLPVLKLNSTNEY